VDASDLAALVPGLVSRHPSCAWTLVSGVARDEDLIVQLHPVAWPERVVSVEVNSVGEVFIFSFEDFESRDFAYVDADRPGTLKESIDVAVAVTSGPTRIIRETAGGLTIRDTLLVDPDGPTPGWHWTISYPVRRLKARLRGLRTMREVIDFPAAAKP
jgi:hypothetical protein